MGSLKLLFGIFLIVGGLYAAFKLMPPYFENYQFQDAVKDEATHDTYSPKTEGDIRDTIYQEGPGTTTFRSDPRASKCSGRDRNTTGSSSSAFLTSCTWTFRDTRWT